MKSEALSSTLLEKENKPGSSPQPAFRRLCRKLSPNKVEKRTPSVDLGAQKCGDLERVFQYLDEDGDGKLSPDELQNCVRTLGGELSPEESKAVVELSDLDGDGLLGFDDFARLMEAVGEEEKDLRVAFGMYEMEGSGCITPKSLKRMLSRLGDSRTIEECKGMISLYDLNGDGVLNFEEFREMMR